MGIKAVISRGSLEKGKTIHLPFRSDCGDADLFLIRKRFGWVNASYQYGLTIVSTHMKRALGTCTPWETFRRATETE